MPKSKIRKRHFLDYSILIPYLILSVVGLIFVYSSTSYIQIVRGLDPTSFVSNQAIFWALSLIVITLMYKMKTDVLKSQQLIVFSTLVIFLLLILTPFIGEEINGAKGWLNFSVLVCSQLSI